MVESALKRSVNSAVDSAVESSLWKVGQKLVCDRPEQLLTGCTVIAQDAESLIVSCPAVNLVLSNQQPQLEALGWKPDDQEGAGFGLPVHPAL